MRPNGGRIQLQHCARGLTRKPGRAAVLSYGRFGQVVAIDAEPLVIAQRRRRALPGASRGVRRGARRTRAAVVFHEEIDGAGAGRPVARLDGDVTTGCLWARNEHVPDGDAFYQVRFTQETLEHDPAVVRAANVPAIVIEQVIDVCPLPTRPYRRVAGVRMGVDGPRHQDRAVRTRVAARHARMVRRATIRVIEWFAR